MSTAEQAAIRREATWIRLSEAQYLVWRAAYRHLAALYLPPVNPTALYHRGLASVNSDMARAFVGHDAALAYKYARRAAHHARWAQVMDGVRVFPL